MLAIVFRSVANRAQGMRKMSDTAARRGWVRRNPWLGPGVLFLAALLVRLINLSHTPVPDEFYHVLAAHSWLEGHGLSISGGDYTRARLFTILVAEFFRFFGESLTVGRIPAMLAGSVLVPTVFLWVRSVADSRSAWAAGILVCISPLLIFLSQIVRFYTLQTLFFFLTSIAVYAVVTRQVRGIYAIWVAVAGICALAFALELQVTSAIGSVGLVVWIAIFGFPGSSPADADVRRIVILVLGVFLVGAAAGAWLWSGHLAGLWHTFHVAPSWQAGMENNHRYYFYWFMGRYPTLWSLFPLAVLGGLVRRLRPVLFATVVFVVALAVHTVAGPKQDRYIAYVLPFFFVVWGIAIGEALPVVAELSRAAARATFGVGLRTGMARWFGWAGVMGVIGFAALSNPAFPLTYRMLTRSDADWTGNSDYRGHSDWAKVVPRLRPWVKGSDVILTTSGVKSLYYFGRYDFEINAGAVRESGTGHDFSTNFRTGHRVIGNVAAIRLVMNCYRTGLVIAGTKRWERAQRLVPRSISDYVRAHAVQIPLPKDSRMIAFKWDHLQNFSLDTRYCRKVR